MIRRHPIATLIVDGRSLTSAEAAVGFAEVRLALGGSHDSARVGVWSSSKLAGSATAARASIGLGDKDDVVDVWAGALTLVQSSDERIVLEGLSHTSTLSRQRLAKTFQEQSVEDIVRDLVGQVDIDEVDASLQLPWYAIDTRRSVWSHLLDLARLIGADVASTASGSVRFVPVRASAGVHTLRHGAEIIQWTFGERTTIDPLEVRAYGAASEAGEQQWHWLLGDVGQSGSGANVVGAVRTKDAAEQTTQARTDRATRQSHRATVLAVGSPSIRPGDVVQLGGVPGAPTDRYRVTSLAHRLDGRRGFTTTLRMEGAA
jgi:hypothetical protein